MIRTLVPSIVGLLLAGVTSAAAQPAAPPPPPPPPWTGSASAGLALTQGNSDTSTINLAYEVKRETAASPWVFKSTGLYLRGDSEGELTTNRLAFNAREDRKLSDRTSVFGQVQYLRDTFKQIDYLVSPNVGVNRWLMKDDTTELGVDVGLGAVWEKNPEAEVKTSGAITAGQSLQYKLTATTTITEKVTGLWKMGDLSDSLYAVTLGIATNITNRVQMKAELLDTYKNKPPSADVVKNDVAFVLSFVYKFQ